MSTYCILVGAQKHRGLDFCMEAPPELPVQNFFIIINLNDHQLASEEREQDHRAGGRAGLQSGRIARLL